jgi:hypothetical protein
MARPKQYDEERIATAVRLPASLHRELHAAAIDRDVSANLLIVRAVRRYLEQLRPVEEDVRSATG